MIPCGHRYFHKLFLTYNEPIRFAQITTTNIASMCLGRLCTPYEMLRYILEDFGRQSAE